MRRDSNQSTDRLDPAVMADAAVVRVRASYLASRWVQAPITDRREAVT